MVASLSWSELQLVGSLAEASLSLAQLSPSLSLVKINSSWLKLVWLGSALPQLVTRFIRPIVISICLSLFENFLLVFRFSSPHFLFENYW